MEADRTAAHTLREGAIPDLTEIPPIGSRQRDDDERAVGSLPVGHEGMHRERGRSCRWMEAKLDG